MEISEDAAAVIAAIQELQTVIGDSCYAIVAVLALIFGFIVAREVLRLWF